MNDIENVGYCFTEGGLVGEMCAGWTIWMYILFVL